MASRSTIKKTILIFLVVLTSFMSGILYMGYLASTASETFVDIIKVQYIHEQEMLAIRSKNNANINEAIRHYRNMIDSKEILHTFEAKKNPWNIFFPFEAIGLRNLRDSSRQRGMEIDAGITHGKLANALEMGGFKSEAEKEYKKASVLTHMSPEEVKRFINNLKNHEIEILKLENHN